MPKIRAGAQCTANVWRILRSEGDAVSEGEEVVVLESMKLEVPVAAPKGGTVTALFVQEGEIVTQGDALFEIEY